MPVTTSLQTKKKRRQVRRIFLTVNNRKIELEVGDGPGQIVPSHTLAHTLRETLGLTETKVSCDHGACGSCTVLIDGEPRLSCLTLTVECAEKTIITIEGLPDQEGNLDPLQQAFIDHNAFQCGFCTPGMILSARALLSAHPSPSEDQITEALSGHFCRCISHYQVIKAVKSVSDKG
jgi:aerobic-type carbon monoxide dehydrogenase small subunit (CoxS/CutS family)